MMSSDDTAIPATGPRWLRDVTVAEITDGLAGSYAAAILASLGAKALKLTAPWTEPQASARPNAVRSALDTDKRVVAAADAEVWRDTLETATIVIADAVSLPAGERHALYEAARHSSQGVLVWLSAFGRTEPLSDWLGSDVIALASGGLLDVGRGFRDVADLPQAEQGLMTGGQVAALASMHGLDRLRAGSSPVVVDVSMQEAVAFVGCLMELSQELAGIPDQKPGEKMPAPTGVFPCRDGAVRICAPDGHQWAATVRALGSPDWAVGLTPDELRADRVAVNGRIAEWTRQRPRAECVSTLQAAGVPVAEVNALADVLRSDQFHARGFLTRRTLADDVNAVLPGRPFTFAADPGAAHPPKALAQTVIAEFSGALAGPLTGTLLGAMGAQVTRVADVKRPEDIYERVGPFLGRVPGVGRSASFNAVNHSKRRATADLSDVMSGEASRLLADADIVIDNLSNSFRARIGLDRPAAAPHSLRLTISGFGRGGPRAAYRAYGANVHAFGGLGATTADSNGWPWEGGQTPLGDTATAVAAATVAAAWSLGGGQPGTADLSMAEVVVSRLAYEIGRSQLLKGADVTPDSTVSTVVEGRGGGKLAVSITSPAVAERLRAFLDAHGLAGEPGGAKDPEALLRRLGRSASARPAMEWCSLLQETGIPAFPVMTLGEVAADPRLRKAGFVTRIDTGVADDPGLRLGLPWRFEGDEPPALSPLRAGDAEV